MGTGTVVGLVGPIVEVEGIAVETPRLERTPGLETRDLGGPGTKVLSPSRSGTEETLETGAPGKR